MSGESPFDEMKGSNAPREIAVHTASALDQLVSIGNGIIERYHPATKGRLEWGEHHKTYTAIEAELAGSELEYSVSDLQDFVRAYCNRDDGEREAITRGMYTGALASVLTKRNREKGEQTHIRINGDGNRFPYLLYHAHTLDELTIGDFKGDYIAAHAAGHGGTANNIMLANITGNWAGEYIAGSNGRVGVVTLANIKGNWAGTTIARSMGRAEIVTLVNITGNWAGENIASHYGRVGAVTLANITGDRAGANIAWNQGRVNTLLAVKNKGENYLNNNHAARTITALNGLANAQQIQSFLDELAQPDHPPEHYTTASKQLGELLREEKQ